MLTVDDEFRILAAAPSNLQRGLFIALGPDRSSKSADPSGQRRENSRFRGAVLLSDFACEVLQAWKEELAPNNPYAFPSPVCPDRPISTVKTA